MSRPSETSKTDGQNDVDQRWKILKDLSITCKLETACMKSINPLPIVLCKDCSAPVGLGSGFIKDAQITASSEWDSNHAAIQGRLNFKAGGGKAGGWSTRQNNANQWIQVALGSYTKLTSIATQGRNGYNQWVTKYKLQYSDDGVNFHYFKETGQSSPKVKPYSSN